MKRLPVLAVCFVMPTFVLAADDSKETVTIRDLKKERLALLVKIHELNRQRHIHEPQIITRDQVHQFKVDVFSARLDLAETKEDRIKVLEDMLKYAEEWEKIIAAMKKGNDPDVSPADVLKAKAFVLESRIALEKAKGK